MNIVEVRCIAAGMTMAQHLFPPNQETASTERHKQAFVWIQHNAIGVFDACQSLASAWLVERSRRMPHRRGTRALHRSLFGQAPAADRSYRGWLFLRWQGC